MTSNIRQTQPLTFPDPVLRIIARFCPYGTAQHLRWACKHHYSTILPFDIRESKLRTLYLSDPLNCFLWMARYGHLNYMKRILSYNPDFANNTTLSYAIRESTIGNHPHVVTYLLTLVEIPFTPTGYVSHDPDPLHIAARNGYTAVLSLLLQNMTVYAGSDTHPIYSAAINGHSESVKCILSHDKHCTDQPHQLITDAIKGAVHGKHPALVSHLLQNHYPWRDLRFYALAEAAVESCDLEVIEVFLQNGAEVSLGYLAYAVEIENIEVVTLLLEYENHFGVEDWEILVERMRMDGAAVEFMEVVREHVRSRGFVLRETEQWTGGDSGVVIPQ